jgi:hypothetical protein
MCLKWVKSDLSKHDSLILTIEILHYYRSYDELTMIVLSCDPRCSAATNRILEFVAACSFCSAKPNVTQKKQQEKPTTLAKYDIAKYHNKLFMFQ